MATGIWNYSGGPKHYIIRNGTVLNGNIVSLAKKGMSSSSFSPDTPPYSTEDGYIQFGWTSALSSGSGVGMVYIDQKVDFSAYTKLCYKGQFVFNTTGSFSYGNCAFECWTDIGTYVHDYKIFQLPINCTTNTDSNAGISNNWKGTFEIDLT